MRADTSRHIARLTGGGRRRARPKRAAVPPVRVGESLHLLAERPVGAPGALQSPLQSGPRRFHLLALREQSLDPPSEIPVLFLEFLALVGQYRDLLLLELEEGPRARRDGGAEAKVRGERLGEESRRDAAGRRLIRRLDVLRMRRRRRRRRRRFRQAHQVGLLSRVLALELGDPPVVVHLLHSQARLHLLDGALSVAKLNLELRHPRLSGALLHAEFHHLVQRHLQRGARLATVHPGDPVDQFGQARVAATCRRQIGRRCHRALVPIGRLGSRRRSDGPAIRRRLRLRLRHVLQVRLHAVYPVVQLA